MASIISRTRMIVFWLSLAFIFIAIKPAPATAQARYAGDEDTKFTISPFLGARMGGRIDINTPNVDYLPIDSSLNWGFNVGARIIPSLFGEFMWNRQTTTLSAHHVLTNDTTVLTNRAHLDLFHGSVLYEFPTGSQLRPFVVAGLGFTHFDSNGILSFSNRFSYNIGGGVKYLLTRQVAVRTELRWSPSRTTTASTVYCDPFLGCFTTPINNHANQWQANIGLELRF
jgi:opacity protein-like surface antigen